MVHAIYAGVVGLNVFVVHLAVDVTEAIDVVYVDVALEDVAVDDDIFVAIVDVNVGDVDMRAAALDPPRAVPAVIVDAMVMPIAVTIEPSANEETYSERNGNAPIRPTVIADPRIVNRNIDVHRVIGNDADVIGFDEDSLLRVANEITHVVSHTPQVLDGHHDIRGLVDIGLAQRGGPVDFISHHVDDRRIVGHGFDADVPGLIVDAIGAVGANPTSGFVDIVDKGGGNEHLGKKRVRIESNGREKIVELLGRKRLVGIFVALKIEFCG